ncbi:MAG: hypothetical protein JNL44_14445 [Gemmatimonadetes bacterium]|nr:hypothetical protein [Gemmatimonadota bacterium]
MDPFRVLLIGGIVVGVTLFGGVILTMLRAAMRRTQDASLRSADASYEARLERIETAVEAIALEVERIGEMQRFSAKADAARLERPRAVERPVTPH